MTTGMLWFDDDPKTSLDYKIQKAAEYYQRKYGLRAEVCLVHPSMLAGRESQVSPLAVRANRIILPGHLWIGAEDMH
jgi:hypothetical protein